MNVLYIVPSTGRVVHVMDDDGTRCTFADKADVQDIVETVPTYFTVCQFCSHEARGGLTARQQVFALREEGLTQRAIAARVGYSPGHVCRILNGTR